MAEQTTYQVLVKQLAQKAGVDPALACAVCEQESSWNPNASRFEPAFLVRYVLPLRLDANEAHDRATSWGLMQLMGEVAREQGFTGELDTLCDPNIGLPQSLQHLKHFLTLEEGNVHAALQRWNGGGNPHYADEVIARIPKYQS